MSKKIVVVQAGWVLIGDMTATPEAIVLENSHVIRRWGTTMGLGELALKGKTHETVLEPTGKITIPPHAVLLVIDVDETKWQ